MALMVPPGENIRALFFDGPPPSTEEIRHVLSRMDPDEARRAFVAMIRDGVLTQHHFGLFVEVAKQLGVAVNDTGPLLALAKDSRLPMMTRKLAVVALTTVQHAGNIVNLFSQIEPELVVAASDMPFIDMLTAIQIDPSISGDLALLLLEASPEEQEYLLLNHIGRIRREVGTPATMAYRYPLEEPALSHLHQHMIDAIVHERDATATALLTDLRDNAVDETARKRFQMALLRMGTKQIEDAPGRNAPSARAFVSICDGQGAFFLICRYRLSGTRSSTITCCIRAAAEIRDAFVFPQHSDAEFEELLAEMESEQLAYTEVPLGKAATIFNNALERTRELGCSLPASVAPVTAIFGRMTAEALENVLGGPRRNDLESLEGMMNEPRFISWFFDVGDLSGHGVVPPCDTADEEWVVGAAQRLADTPLRRRLLAMLEHMIRWHIWARDVAAAEVCRGAYHSVFEAFPESPMVRLMLARSLSEAPLALDDAVLDDMEYGLYGDVALRTMIRRRFFPALKRPSGKHVAELDFTEVVFHRLQASFGQLPGEKRPREDDILDVSYEIATAIVQSMSRERDAGMMIEKVDKILDKRTSLLSAERKEVVTCVVEGLFAFVDAACQRCSKQCLQYPRRGMGDVFFSPEHPAFK